jgi:DNA repair exonuclease SbcCD ATPase subunit
MILTKAVIKNYLSIREATVLLGNRGLVSVEGVTKDADGADSNGSGKSTLINAILWCNYGDPGKKLKSADEVVSKGSKGGTQVDNYWYDELAKVTYKVTRYRKHPKFANSLTIALVEGESLVDISKGTVVETQALLVELLGADQKTFEASCFARQGSAPDIPGMTDGELKALLEKVLPFDDLGSLYKKASANASAQLDIVKATERDIERTTVRLSDLTMTIDITTESRDNWGLEQEAVKATYVEQIRLAKEEVDGLTATLKPMAKIEEAITKYQTLVDAYDDAPRIKYIHDGSRLDQRVSEAFQAVRSVADKCKTCLRPYDDYMQAIATAERELTDARAAKSVHEASGSWIRPSLEAHGENKTKLERIVMLKRTQERQLVHIERARERQERFEEALAQTPTNPHIAALEGLQDRHKTLVDESNRLEEKLIEDKYRLEVLEAVAETYSPKGVRYHILEEATPTLTNRTNHYLRQLTDGSMRAAWSTVTKLKSGEYREKFSIDVTGKGFSSYGSLSGGEQRKVRLACFFALQDLIASRATKSIGLWCGDEIDHALDSAGLERLMSLLHEKTKTKPTILVISHNELRQWIPNFTTVVKTDGISKITGYLSDS